MNIPLLRIIDGTIMTATVVGVILLVMLLAGCATAGDPVRFCNAIGGSGERPIVKCGVSQSFTEQR
jgi:uncharacterized lipoprotein YajG